MASHYRRFIKDFAKLACPLTKLTKKNENLEWGHEQEASFNEIKTRLTSAPILAYFDPKLPTEVRCDGSKIGLGGILLQTHPDDTQRVVAFASRMTNQAEKNYPIPEIEALAIVFSLTKFRTYVVGTKFKVYTDHCALCWMVSKKNLSQRLTKWALMLQDYDFSVVYKSGKNHKDADCLSRCPVDAPESEQTLESKLSFDFTNVIQTLANIQNLQTSDPKLRSIIELCSKNNKNEREVKRVKDFAYKDGVLYRIRNDPGGPILVVAIPRTMSKQVLAACHDDPFGGHLGVHKTYDKIKTRFYFPGMGKYVNKYVKTCARCQERKRAPFMPPGLLQPITVGGVCERYGIDILGPFPKSYKDNKYVVVATEYLTRFAIARALPDATTALIAMFVVEDLICTFGCPREILSDRGVQFRSNLMRDLLNYVQIKAKFTTAYHPQCNGLTERYNKTLVEMISKYIEKSQREWDRMLHLLMFAYNCSVNRTTGFTPFHLMYGREPVLPIERRLELPQPSYTD